MKTSIVTISYNQARFLEKCIQSVLQQSHPDIEYIIVDPGSTDDSRKIIGEYSKQIDKIILNPDDGPADGLNAGFKLATGDIFGFLNADDILLPGAINKVVKAFKKSSRADVVVGHGIVIDHLGRELRKVYSDRFSLFRSAYGASILVQPSTFFRNSVFQSTGGFNSANRSSWDDELFVDMKIKGAQFLMIDAFLSGYRLHSLSITGSKKLDAESKIYYETRFKKIMHRAMNQFDYPLGNLLRIIRHFTNYRDTYERIMKGPIYGRYFSDNLTESRK